jgi:predicted ABC-type transport system involved in lysophospholipase L1 biosynthesis ATPase subunit
MTIVVVTHDPDVAQRCTRTIELKDGLIDSDSVNATDSSPR